MLARLSKSKALSFSLAVLMATMLTILPFRQAIAESTVARDVVNQSREIVEQGVEQVEGAIGVAQKIGEGVLDIADLADELDPGIIPDEVFEIGGDYLKELDNMSDALGELADAAGFIFDALDIGALVVDVIATAKTEGFASAFNMAVREALIYAAPKIASTGGKWLGTAIGTAVGGPIGGYLGGIAGGWLAGKAGKWLAEEGIPAFYDKFLAAKITQFGDWIWENTFGKKDDPSASDGYNAESPSQGNDYNADNPSQGSDYNAESPSQGSDYNAESPSQGSDYNADNPSQGSDYNAESPSQGSDYNAEDKSKGSGYDTPGYEHRHDYDTPGYEHRHDYDTPGYEVPKY